MLGCSAIDYVINSHGTHALSDLGEELQGAQFSPTAGESSTIDDVRVSDFVVEPARRRKLEAVFLSALEYDGMLDRECTVAEAHQATFQWIFREDTVHKPSGRASLSGFNHLISYIGSLERLGLESRP